MDDALRPIDLDYRPVGLHGADLATGDARQQTGAIQVVQRVGAFSPAAVLGLECGWAGRE